MSLDKIFQKQEKVEEKKLEVIKTESATIDELLAFFEKSIPTKKDSWEEDFEDYKKYLWGYQKITPDLISKINLVFPKNRPVECYFTYEGVFLSALIQTSYNQSCNGFVFEEIEANRFGACLLGKPNSPIVIEAEKINGCWAFWEAKNVVAEIQQFNGNHGFGVGMKNCTIYSPNQQTLETLEKQTTPHRYTNEFVLGNMPQELKCAH